MSTKCRDWRGSSVGSAAESGTTGFEGMPTFAPEEATLAVFGGSFDPPHIGHVMVPSYLLSMGLADRVLVCPAQTHVLGKVLSPFEKRLGWVRAAMAVHGVKVEVSDLERRLDAGEEPRDVPRGSTLRLLEAVVRAFPSVRVRLVVGGDIIESGETARWHRWGEIERRFDPIVIPRAGHGEGTCALPEISSREVRAALNRDDAEASAFVEASVPAAVRRQLDPPAKPRSLLLVGRGNVATHAERWLREAGWLVQTVGGRAFANGEVSVPSGTLDGVWVLVGDPHIPVIAARLAREALDVNVPVLHGAGAIRADSEAALSSVRANGNPVGTLHPICALRREVDTHMLSECAFGVEGDEAATALVGQLVPRTRQVVLDGLSEGDRVRYHAACSLAANFVGAFQVLAAREFDAVGLDKDRAGHAISVLTESSLFNLAKLGFPAGVTGPVSRGDHEAVRRHTGELQGAAREVYETMTEVLKGLLVADSVG